MRQDENLICAQRFIESLVILCCMLELIHSRLVIGRGAELPIEEAPLLQEEILRICRSMGKAVIVATNMLESSESYAHSLITD
ncbi:hypothetical protein Q3G72_007076 [Acer saccharum]|nr:hypothetical protein Q3G72_007076 [Acer saccharum]